jgi:hypothetical protein
MNPVISTLNPGRVGLKTPGFTLTLDGQYFQTTSVMCWNGIPLATTVVNYTRITAWVPYFLIPTRLPSRTAFKTAIITVYDSYHEFESDPMSFIINKNPKPVISGLSQYSALVYDPGFVLHVSGANFSVNSQIVWNGKKQPTTFVSSTELYATIYTSMFPKAKGYPVKVYTPGPGGGSSRSLRLVVTNPVPVLGTVTANINPLTILSRGVVLTVTGDKFIKPAKVYWNGVRLSTRFVNSQVLTVRVPNRLLRTAGDVTIYVWNKAPGGGLSNTVSPVLTVNNP